MTSGTAELTCKELVEQVTTWLDNALPPGERARFDMHLAACPSCAAYLAQIRLTMTALGRLAEERVDPAARDALLRQYRMWRQESV